MSIVLRGRDLKLAFNPMWCIRLGTSMWLDCFDDNSIFKETQRSGITVYRKGQVRLRRSSSGFIRSGFIQLSILITLHHESKHHL